MWVWGSRCSPTGQDLEKGSYKLESSVMSLYALTASGEVSWDLDSSWETASTTRDTDLGARNVELRLSGYVQANLLNTDQILRRRVSELTKKKRKDHSRLLQGHLEEWSSARSFLRSQI